MDELEVEDETEEADRILALSNDDEQIHELPAAYESGSSSSDESDEPDRAASMARDVQAQTRAIPEKKKSVSFESGTKEEDAPSRSSGLVRPVREFVTEVEPQSDYKIKPSDLQSESEDEESDENAGYEFSDDEEEDQPHIDDLLLSRELALEYHKKRFQLAGSDRAMASAVDQEVRLSLVHRLCLLERQMVSKDSTLLEDGSSSSIRPSRFRAGPLDMGSLVVPNILQQRELKPGDVIEDLPLEGYKYTADDEKTIEDRLARLKMGSEDVFERKAEATVQEEPKKEAIKDAVMERVQAVKPVVSEKATADAPQPPKKVSRYVVQQSFRI